MIGIPWLSWIYVCSLVSSYGIWKLILIVKELSANNPYLKFNIFQIAIHCVLLLMQSVLYTTLLVTIRSEQYIVYCTFTL